MTFGQQFQLSAFTDVSLSASWNNILVLPECFSPTPASVILLQAVRPHLQSRRHVGQCVCLSRDGKVKDILLNYVKYALVHAELFEESKESSLPFTYCVS